VDRQRSIELGWRTRWGSVDYVAREIIKAEKIVDFTPREICRATSQALRRGVGRIIGAHRCSASPVR